MAQAAGRDRGALAAEHQLALNHDRPKSLCNEPQYSRFIEFCIESVSPPAEGIADPQESEERRGLSGRLGAQYKLREVLQDLESPDSEPLCPRTRTSDQM